jgi:hypothetical protein
VTVGVLHSQALQGITCRFAMPPARKRRILNMLRLIGRRMDDLQSEGALIKGFWNWAFGGTSPKVAEGLFPRSRNAKGLRVTISRKRNQESVAAGTSAESGTPIALPINEVPPPLSEV